MAKQPSQAYLSTSRYPLLRLLSYMRGYRKNYLLALLYSSLNKLFDIFPEILLGVAVNLVVAQKNSWIAQLTGLQSFFAQLLILGVATFTVWLLESCFQYLYSLQWRNLAQNVEHQLRIEVYDTIQKGSLDQIEKTPAGQLMATINDDINQMERFLEDGINQIVQLIVSTIFIGAIFLYASPLITLLAIMPIPAIIIGTFYFQHRLAPRFMAVRQKAAEISEALQRNLLGLLTIKSYTTEDYEKQRIQRASAAYQQANKKTIQISAMVTPIIRMFVLTGFLFTLLMGGYKTLHGDMDIGLFSMLIFLSQRLLWPFNNLAAVTVDYQRVMASTTRVLDLLTWLPEVSAKKADHFDAGKHPLIFHDVSFYYPQTRKKILSHFNLTIEKNKTMAFVGESGAGKTTLIKLICRFYTPNNGAIYYGKQDIHTIDLTQWRSQIALVSQEPFLFDGTIRENILYGANNKKDEQMLVKAAQMAGAHEFIMQCSEGYDSYIGQRGVLLSGGQKQRLSIARAIIKDAPILILDEATSAVDNETEFAIQRALNTLAKTKTTIIIAHRLSTIRHADNICVMDRGAIVEQGNHQQLLAKGGQYARLWQIQTGAIIPN